MGPRTDDAFLIMLGQGSMALGSVLWATGVAHVGLDLTFLVAAVLALAVPSAERRSIFSDIALERAASDRAAGSGRARVVGRFAF